MGRPQSPHRAAEDEAFLAALARTGNARLAARALGVNRSTYLKRRARDPAFAARWDTILAAAHAHFVRAGGLRRPAAPGLRSAGGEPHIVRTAGRRLQLRHAPPGRLTEGAERAALAALEEGNNLRAAAHAVGAAHATLIARRRAASKIARGHRIARRVARDRLWLALRRQTDAEREEAELLRAAVSLIFPPPPLPSVADAIALLQIHFARNEGRHPGSRQARAAAIERVALEEVRASIFTAIAALRREAHHNRTGRWRYDGEE